MVATPSRAQARLDKAKAKRDRCMVRVDKREVKGQDKIKRQVAKSRAPFGPESHARAFEIQWNIQARRWGRLRVRIDKKFAKAQARYDKAPDVPSK